MPFDAVTFNFFSTMLVLILLTHWLYVVRPPASADDWTQRVGGQTRPTRQALVPTANFGAVGEGQTLNTRAIQRAIDACAAEGGGIVTFKPGQYLTGSLFLKKGVTLRLDAGVTLLGSQSLADYPEIDTRVAGIEMRWPAALLNIIDQENVAIVGKGTVNARGKPFWNSYWALRKEYEKKGLRWIVDYDCKRPRTLLVSGASNVTLRDITLQQAGFWTVHILYSKHVTADGLVIRNNIGGHGPSTDGIDIDSSTYILVQNCDIDCNDDNFCLTFGSETSGGIRHVLARNLRAKGTGVGIRLKSATTRGGTVEDVRIEDIRMAGVDVPVEVTMNWNPSYSYLTLPAGYVEPAERGIPHFRNVRIANLAVSNDKRGIVAAGLAASRLEGFTLEDVTITAQTAGEIDYATNWTLRNVRIQAKDNQPISRLR